MDQNKTYPHQPVLVEQLLTALRPLSLHTVIDGTVGAAGHSSALLREHAEIETLLALDQDLSALALAQQRLAPWQDKVLFAHSNFRDMTARAGERGVGPADLILLDLGVSSMQLDRGERGFSFMREGPLDMRMDGSQGLTAGDIVNGWSEEALSRLFRDLGEERQARRAARLIATRRRQGPLTTTKELADLLEPLAGGQRRRTLHPATLVFQALRLAVNDELGALQAALPQAFELLRVGGVLAIITFHSLEDRLVKNFYRALASDKEETSGLAGLFRDKPVKAELLTKKPLSASIDEEQSNPRARSAKMRLLRKLHP